MHRVTPTQLAEEAYQASLAKPMAMGPAGIAIPQARSIYRKTVDGPLLTSIHKAAYTAHRLRRLPPAALARGAEILRADLLQRFPPADMTVLERYGLAKSCDSGIVRLNTATYDNPWYPEFREPVTIPDKAACWGAEMGGAYPVTDALVPDAVLPLLETMVDLARERREKFEAVTMWVSRFRTDKGRFPFWREIEEGFPLIGQWLAAQRAEIKERAA